MPNIQTGTPAPSANYVPKLSTATNVVNSVIYQNGANIGIGTTTPAFTLDVNGIIQLTGFKLPMSPINGYVLTSDASGVGTWKPAVTGTPNILSKFTGTNTIGDSVIYESGGNVGIGTATPVTNLDVQGTVKLGPTNTGIYLDAATNVGIGTATPGSKLDVRGDATFNGEVRIGSTGTSRKLTVLGPIQGRTTAATEVPGVFEGVTGGRLLSGQVGGSEKFGVDANGNIVASGTVRMSGFQLPAQPSVDTSNFVLTSDANGVGTWRPALGGVGSSVITEVGGNIGIGTTTPGVPLEVNGYIQSAALKVQAGSATGDPYIVMNRKYGGAEVETKTIAVRGPTGGTWLALGDYATPDVLTIWNGFVGIGTTNPREKLHVVGHLVCTGNISCDMELFSSRGYCTGSSKRWKKNIEPLTDALNTLQCLQGVSFDWKEDGRHDIGFIAEDVGNAVPEVVKYEENGEDAKGMDYGRLTVILVEAVKEQQNQIDELRALVKSLLADKEMATV